MIYLDKNDKKKSLPLFAKSDPLAEGCQKVQLSNKQLQSRRYFQSGESRFAEGTYVPSSGFGINIVPLLYKDFEATFTLLRFHFYRFLLIKTLPVHIAPFSNKYAMKRIGVHIAPALPAKTGPWKGHPRQQIKSRGPSHKNRNRSKSI